MIMLDRGDLAETRPLLDTGPSQTSAQRLLLLAFSEFLRDSAALMNCSVVVIGDIFVICSTCPFLVH